MNYKTEPNPHGVYWGKGERGGVSVGRPGQGWKGKEKREEAGKGEEEVVDRWEVLA